KTFVGPAPNAEPGLIESSPSALSPLAGANASTYTSALTLRLPLAAFVITAPPYECPTRTIGPLIVLRKSAIVAASPFRLCSGLGGALTVYPFDCRRSITPLQTALLAHAPLTRTTVGRTDVVVLVRVFAWGCDVARVIVRAAINASPIVSQRYVTRRSTSRCMGSSFR